MAIPRQAFSFLRLCMEVGALGVAAVQGVFWALERFLVRCPAAPPCPACNCPPLSVALTCSGTASTATSLPPTGSEWPAAFWVGLFLGVCVAAGPRLFFVGQRWVRRAREEREEPAPADQPVGEKLVVAEPRGARRGLAA